jgi:O-antigen ligase
VIPELRGPSRRERWALAAITVAPLLIYFLVRIFGFLSYLKLAGMAAVGIGGCMLLMVRPRWSLWFVIFYVYAGLNYYFPFNAAFLATLIALAAVMVELVRTPRDLRALMYVLFASGIAIVVFGVMNLVLGIQSVGDNFIGHAGEYTLRFTSTHENPNRSAAYMCSALPMGIFAVKYARRALKPLWILCVVILVVAIYATFSRSVAFPLAMITGSVLVREVRSRRSFLVTVAMIAIAVALVPKEWWNRVFGLGAAFQTTTLDWSVYVRLLALHTAWALFLAHPLTGVGIGNFVVASAYNVFYRIVVHNSYLEILVGMGIFGLLCLFLIQYSGFRHIAAGARARWDGQPEWMRSACFYCALSALSIWMSAFFGTIPFAHPFWVPVAIGIVIANLLREQAPAATSAH